MWERCAVSSFARHYARTGVSARVCDSLQYRSESEIWQGDTCDLVCCVAVALSDCVADWGHWPNAHVHVQPRSGSSQPA